MEERDQGRIVAIQQALDGFEEVARSLHGDDWYQPTGCPGWSVKDNVSHVVGLESVLLGDDEPDTDLAGDLPHVRDQMGRYLETHVEARRDSRVGDLIDELGEVFARRRAMLADQSDIEVEVPAPLGATWPLKTFLAIRTFDIWAHQQDIRRAVGRPGRLDDAAAAVALTRMLRGFAHFLPTRLGKPRASLSFEVVGPQTGALHLDLESGESLPADHLDWTVSVVMDFADLVPLACGRDDAPDPAKVAKVDGDAGLAGRLLTELTVTP